MMQTHINFISAQPYAESENEAVARDAAIKKFDMAYIQGRLHTLWTRLFHRPHRLLTLKEMEASVAVGNRHFEGIKAVPIDQIRGSENRSHDFDDQFNPLQRHDRERWVSVAAAMQQERGLPPVELIKVGETFFVRDGHHRISVARALGQKDVDASVTAWRVFCECRKKCSDR